MGNLFGNTRTRHPGVSAVPSPVRTRSGGVSPSLPGQKGHGPPRSSSGAGRVAPTNWWGRAARPAATITTRPASWSCRSSAECWGDIASRLRVPGTPDIAPTIGGMPRLVIIGGGPAGNTCASVAATLGADVTMIERDIVGGAAHLWDCIPSKALIATGRELVELQP